MSSFLQERLERERQTEAYKTNGAASPSSKSGSMSAGLDMARMNQSSPSRDSSTNRPQSSSGDSGKKGHGVKEMEQVISSLHKQNFDLKLELYHRRERQTALEDRVESLESDKAQVEQMNDKLVEELEKRDKAVEEAVAMIITLEAKMDQLAQERRMVQQIEAEGMFQTPRFGSGYQQSGLPSNMDNSRLEEDERTLARMPSFLSERTENTENLRNVYLRRQSSIASLPRAAEPVEGLGSPSLSILSESSFISVYGQKGQGQTTLPEIQDPLSLDGVFSKTVSVTDTPRPRTATNRSTPAKKSPSTSSSRTNVNGQFQSITDIVEHGSPLQRLEKMDPNYAKRPKSSGRDTSTMSSSRSNKSPARRKTRDEKREGLRKVITDAPGGVRLQEHALPPTPDTMSSATLRRYGNSNDTLEAENRTTMDNVPFVPEKQVEERVQVPLQRQAQPKFLDLSVNAYPDHIAAIRRPRSADETTISQRRGNDWGDESDEDMPSLRSSLDIWLREGGSKQNVDGRASPDLFGFPTTASRSWATDAMFGPGTAYAGGAPVMDSGEAMDDLFSAQGKAEHEGPPAPGRRSSYHARTGSSSATPTMTSQTPAQMTPKQKTPNRRPPRHMRGNSVDARTRPASQSTAPTTIIQPSIEPQQPLEKRGHYPPLSGSGGARAGFNRLFRRSLGGAADAGLPPRSPSAPVEIRPPPEAPPAPLQKSTMGTPSWVSRSGVVDDDRASATPPPIMRNSRHQRESSLSTEQHYDERDSSGSSVKTPTGMGVYPQPMEVQAPLSPALGGPAPQPQQGGRRKWLGGFGRSSSVKNRTG